jgi:site-specific DNA recombinase
VLHDRVCTGKYEYNKFNSQTGRQRPREEWIEIMTDRTISDEDFAKAAQIMDTRAPDKNEDRIYRGPLLLTGLLKCGHCGAQMVSAGTKKDGKMYRYYCCKTYMQSGKDACPGCRVRVDQFEPVVLDTVLDWIFSMDNVLPVVKALRKALKDRSKPLKALRHRIEEVEAALARYQEGFEQGAFTVNDVAERFRELAAKKRAMEDEYAQRSTIQPFPAELAKTENVARIQERLKEVFRTASSHTKKQYLHALVEHIVFDGKRVEVKARNDGIIAVLENLEALEAGDVAKVISQAKKWQPVGDSNPCDRTENSILYDLIVTDSDKMRQTK